MHVQNVVKIIQINIERKMDIFSKKFKRESQNTGQQRKNRGENLPDLKHIRG